MVGAPFIFFEKDVFSSIRKITESFLRGINNMNTTEQSDTSYQIKIDSTDFNQKNIWSRKKNSIFRLKIIKIICFIICLSFVSLSVLVGIHGIPLLKHYQTMAGQMERVTTNQFHQLLSTSQVIQPGMNIHDFQLRKRLTALGYQLGDRNNLIEGEYVLVQNKIFIKPKQYESYTNNLIVIDLSNEEIELISEVESGKIISKLFCA